MIKNREILAKLIKYIDLPEIIVLHGARQVGKTTLMKISMDFLRKRDNNDLFYFDLEQQEFLNLCNKGAEEVIGYINSRKTHPDKKIFLFIDEIQYLDNPSSFLKLFYDYYKDTIKLIVSGSSSFAIKSKFKDSLVGRILDIEVFGLSFPEFLDFKNLRFDLNVRNNLADKELKKLFEEYCIYGFYPQVVLADNIELKEIYLNGIIEKYIYKDISDLANIRNIDKFNNLLSLLASQVSGLVNLNELSDTLKIARQTIEEYLFILENTFIIRLLKPYHNNIRGELSKMPKIFFEDNGILNILSNKRLKNNIDGHLFENSIYTILRRKYLIQNIHFWRTTSRQEVDFIIDEKILFAKEVKLGEQRILPSGLNSFNKKYHKSKSEIITLAKNNILEIEQKFPWELIID